MSFEIYQVNPVTSEQYRLVDELDLEARINSRNSSVTIIRNDYVSSEEYKVQFENLTGRKFGTPYIGEQYLEDFMDGKRRLRAVNIVFKPESL